MFESEVTMVRTVAPATSPVRIVTTVQTIEYYLKHEIIRDRLFGKEASKNRPARKGIGAGSNHGSKDETVPADTMVSLLVRENCRDARGASSTRLTIREIQIPKGTKVRLFGRVDQSSEDFTIADFTIEVERTEKYTRSEQFIVRSGGVHATRILPPVLLRQAGTQHLSLSLSTKMYPAM